MRALTILLIALVACSCKLLSHNQEVVSPVAPSPVHGLPDLTVSNVRFWWSEQWVCGVDIHITIHNDGTTNATNFYLSLNDQRKWVDLVPANSEAIITVTMTGEEIQSWMRASGTVDVDQTLTESDETNNDYNQALPYSAVPGMESIALCVMSQTPPVPTPTATKPAHSPTTPATTSPITLTPTLAPT